MKTAAAGQLFWLKKSDQLPKNIRAIPEKSNQIHFDLIISQFRQGVDPAFSTILNLLVLAVENRCCYQLSTDIYTLLHNIIKYMLTIRPKMQILCGTIIAQGQALMLS